METKDQTNTYVEVLNTVYKLSEGALQGVAEALRLTAKLSGLGREASPSAEGNSMGFFIPTY
ncbi:hypothetical protein [Sporosarcina sp. FA15]|uniref:hypothetical protein n=1 Tax=Sporosarcina sp. FA15 TaxID=3413031 RepID=UPI0030FDF676